MSDVHKWRKMKESSALSMNLCLKWSFLLREHQLFDWFATILTSFFSGRFRLLFQVAFPAEEFKGRIKIPAIPKATINLPATREMFVLLIPDQRFAAAHIRVVMLKTGALALPF